jgi:hypothetical protein
MRRRRNEAPIKLIAARPNFTMPGCRRLSDKRASATTILRVNAPRK